MDEATPEQRLGALARDLAALRQRVAGFPSFATTDALVEDVALRTLDRVDMLLALYRDGVEQELALMRDALVQVAQGVPDPLACLTGTVRPPRSPRAERPALLFDEGLMLESGVIDVRREGEHAHGLLREAVEIGLEAPVAPGQLVVAQGVGARSAMDLLQWEMTVGGAPILGRYELWEDGRWRFVGRVMRVEAQADEAWDKLRIAPGGSFRHQPLEAAALAIADIRFPHALVNAIDPADLPCGAAQHVAGPIGGSGWHRAEMGDWGAYRWMAEQGEVALDLQPGVARVLTLLGENSVPHEGEPDEALTLLCDGVVLDKQIEIAGSNAGWGRWKARAAVPADVGGMGARFALVPAPGMARPPRDFGAGDDPRILSFALRAMVWDRQAG